MKSVLRTVACLLLVFLMAFSSVINVWAADVSSENVITEYLTDGYLSETVECEMLKTNAIVDVGFSSFELPSVTETQEVLWYDRLANKPLYAQKFYNWLIENSKMGGALVTATETPLSDTIQAHLVTEISAEKTFKLYRNATEEQIMQAAVNAIAEEIETQFYVASRWINEIMACFDHDYPEVFWLGNVVSTMYELNDAVIFYDQSTYVGTINYVQNIYFALKSDSFDLRLENYRNEGAIVADILARNSIVENLNGRVDGKSDYEKITFFNNFLTANNGYNANLYTAFPQAWECISALKCVSGREAPVCEGYARALKVLCDEAGIPCVLATGYAGEAHMWNYVNLEGKWYAVDVTWNDPGLLTEGKPTSGEENEKYLLVGADTVINDKKFAESHVLSNVVFENGVFYLNGPQLSLVSYNARIEHKCSHSDKLCTFCGCSINDVNRDGLVNIIDFVSLKTAVLEENDIGNFDCNIDGVINGVDLTYFRKLLWEKF